MRSPASRIPPSDAPFGFSKQLPRANKTAGTETLTKVARSAAVDISPDIAIAAIRLMQAR